MVEPGDSTGAGAVGVDLSSFGLDRSAEEVVERIRAAERPLELGRLGEYELLDVAGIGGQGVVYKARRAKTARDVALKRVFAGAPGRGVARERFAREIEVDFALRHPNIVTVYGVEEADGQPLLAMEWIDGVAIDRWAGWHAPPLRDPSPSDGPPSDGPPAPPRSVEEVLRAFLKVCDGVQHAHQRGVIHRDLKPSNILVDAAGEPRVLDFGLAKLTESTGGAGAAGAGGTSRLTHSGGFLGTLAYAAPEQVRGDADGVDVRTDVYALGCVLYQCLTGKVPFDRREDLAALTRAICEVEAARVSSVRRGIDADVDAIVARAMAKDKARRYQSVDALSSDVRRQLAGEPVEARRGARWYVLRKTLRRHRVAVAVGVLVATLVIGAAVVSTLSWRAQARQRVMAEHVSEFMEGMLESVGPYVAVGRDTALLREVLDGAARRIEDGALRTAPEAEIRLRRSIGNTFRQMAQYDEAESMLRPAVELARAVYGEPHDAVATLLNDVALVLADRGDGAGGLALASEALDQSRGVHTGNDLEVVRRLNGVGFCLLTLGKHADALGMFEQAVAMNKALGASDTPETVEIVSNAAYCLRELGRADEALPLDLACLDMTRRMYPDDHPSLAISTNNVGADLQVLGQFAEALPYVQDALGIFRRLYPADHPHVAQALSNAAAVLSYLSQFDKALPLLHESVEMSRRLFPGDHASVADALNNLGACLQSLERAPEALPYLAEALEMNRRLFGEESERVALMLHHVADAKHAIGESDDAARLAAESVALYRRHPEWQPWEHRHALEVLINAALRAGREEAARTAVRELLALSEPEPTVARAATLARVASMLLRAEWHADAEPLARECLTIRLEKIPEGWLTFNTKSLLGAALAGQGAALRESDPDRARALLSEAEPLLIDGYAGMKDSPEAPPSRVREALERIVFLYDHNGQPDNAAEYRARLAAESITPPRPAP